jgi:serine/threonine protein kinase
VQRVSLELDGTVLAGCRIGQELVRRDARYTAFEAVDERTSSPVVVKLVDPALAGTRGFRERFLMDLMLQAPLRSPHVLRVLDGGTSEHGLFLVTQRPGPINLAELDDMTLGPQRAVRLVSGIADALDRAHALNLVHGSLQPRSVWLETDGRPRVDDFCFSGGGNDAPWAAPEQADGRPPTPAADVYALGAIAYTCLARTRPPAAGRRLDVPRAFEAPLRRALSAEPGRRQGSAGELADALARAAQGAAPAEVGARPESKASAPAEREARPHPKPEPQRRARPKPAATRRSLSPAVRRLGLNAAGAAVVVAAALIGLALGRGDSPPVAPSAAPVAVRSGPVALTAPPDWKPISAPSSGLGAEYAERPVTLTGGGATLVAGPVAAEDADFVRAALSGTRAEEAPVARPVTLGDLPALRFSGLRSDDDEKVLDLYALRTSTGILTVTCAAGAGEAARALLQRCGAVAASIELRGTVPLEVRPSAEYNAALASTLGRAAAARARERAKLAKPTRRAPGAASLARAFAAAARELDAIAPPAIAEVRHAALTQAVVRTQRAYAGLAAAGRRANRAAYRRRASAVARAEEGVRRAVLSMRSLGYRVA